MSKEVCFVGAQRPVPCDACDDEVPGTYYCIQCRKTLCEDCEKFHKKITSYHDVVLRTKIGDVDIKTLACTEHAGYASFYCEKCKVPICPECVTGKHQGHKLINLNDVVETQTSLLQGEISTMQKDILPKLVRQKEEIQRERVSYETKVKEITKNMETEYHDARQELDRVHKERVRSLNSIVRSNLTIFDECATQIKTKVESCDGRISEYQDAIRGSVPSVLFNFVERRTTLTEISILPTLPHPPTFEPGNMTMISESLGKLKLKTLRLTSPKIISIIKFPLKGRPSIFINKEGEIWLGGDNSKTLVKVNLNGEILEKRNIKNRPNALAVMDCGDVIVSPCSEDSRSVSRFQRDNKKQQVLNTSPSYSYGVSVTADQNILICTWDGRVMKTNCDGTHIEQIYQGRGEGSSVHAVEGNDGSVFITDFSNSDLIIVKRDASQSKKQHPVEREKMGKPAGLVVDRMGNILCSDQGNQCVYIIEKNKTVRELVGRSHGIEFPRWLGVDNDDNLWITQKSGPVVVVKYLLSD